MKVDVLLYAGSGCIQGFWDFFPGVFLYFRGELMKKIL